MVGSLGFRLAGVFVAVLAAVSFIAARFVGGPWQPIGWVLVVVAFAWLAYARHVRAQQRAQVGTSRGGER